MDALVEQAHDLLSTTRILLDSPAADDPDIRAKAAEKGVTVYDVRKNNAIWEIHMRLALDEDNEALQSHRGWVFQNLSYLVGKDGEPIDNAGFETTRQSRNEVGIAYLFDLPDAGFVRLEVFDILGRRVASLIDGMLPAGRHTTRFEGATLPSGPYFYRLEHGARSETRRMIMSR